MKEDKLEQELEEAVQNAQDLQLSLEKTTREAEDKFNKVGVERQATTKISVHLVVPRNVCAPFECVLCVYATMMQASLAFLEEKEQFNKDIIRLKKEVWVVIPS